jgi:hypothetical protein
MRTLLIFSTFIILSACTTADDHLKDCMKIHKTIQTQVSCLKHSIYQDQGLGDDLHVQELLKHGDVLVEKVAHHDMTEKQAQLALVKKHNQIRRDALRERAYEAEIDRANRNKFPRETHCQMGKGGDLHCTTY